MASNNSDLDQHKRKRDIADDRPDRIPQPPPPQSGNAIPINYLSKSQVSRLKLIHGDGDTFADVLGLINEYEGVLNRHESLAFNLGAKLTGARLLKAMEGAFEGSIVTNPPQSHFAPDPITWLDIVNFARSNPQEFQLSAMPTGMRSCQFPLKGTQVEISEDDWRLIKSGALERFRLAQPEPLEEDENAELATLDILEQRLQVLIKKADEVARKARQLNYHLSGRKASIHARHPSQPGAGSKFQSVNPGQSTGANPGYDVHADLLQQFMAPSQVGSHRLSSVSSMPPTPNPVLATSSTPRPTFQQPVLSSSNRPSPSYISDPQAKDSEEEYRLLITSRIEHLPRGDTIRPPCDRCRRLKTTCIKHLTACQGCTKKHTKCTWKKLTDEEIAALGGEMGVEGDEDDDEARDWRRPFSGAGMAPAPGLFNLRTESTPVHETSALSSSGARVVVNRHNDDVWRKGPSGPAVNRDDSMDIDSTSRLRFPPEDSAFAAMHVRQVASAASAHADAAAASRESHHRQ